MKLTDLQLAVQIIDLASEKGVFKGGDLKTVGEVRERIIDFIKLNATPAPVEEGTVAAEAVDTTAAPVATE